MSFVFNLTCIVSKLPLRKNSPFQCTKQQVKQEDKHCINITVILILKSSKVIFTTVDNWDTIVFVQNKSTRVQYINETWKYCQYLPQVQCLKKLYQIMT